MSVRMNSNSLSLMDLSSFRYRHVPEGNVGPAQISLRRASGKNCRDASGKGAPGGCQGCRGALVCFIPLPTSRLGKRPARWHALCLNGPRMLDPIFQSGNFQLAQKLLDGAALRQQAIAANIANAETPGYRRVDVAPDFAEHLKASFQSGDRDALADTVQPKLTEDGA